MDQLTATWNRWIQHHMANEVEGRLPRKGTELTMSTAPSSIPRLAEVRVDGDVLGFAALIGVVARAY